MPNALFDVNGRLVARATCALHNTYGVALFVVARHCWEFEQGGGGTEE